MVSLAQIWIPVVSAAVLVFIASSLIHMVFKWHQADYSKLGNEDEVRAAINKSRPAPGFYVMPYYMDMKALQDPEALRRYNEGPVAFLTVKASGLPKMGVPLALWFALSLGIAFVAGYLAVKTLPAGAGFMEVFRVVSVIAFLAYGAGSVSDGIWMGRPWPSVGRDLLDAVIYAVLTALPFAWLWP